MTKEERRRLAARKKRRRTAIARATILGMAVMAASLVSYLAING